MKTSKPETQDNYAIPVSYLNEQGLNMQAVFNLNELPDDVCQILGLGRDLSQYRQLLLIAHGGTQMWESLTDSEIRTDNPVDDFSIKTIKTYFNHYLSACSIINSEQKYEVIYPSEDPNNQHIGLQRLGELAGWHHTTPMKVGINPTWGTWYAYRAVVLANTNFSVTEKVISNSPCNSCVDKFCVRSCPACVDSVHSLADASDIESSGDIKSPGDSDIGISINKCIQYRKEKGSKCKNRCLARTSCPVGNENKYSEAQINYHYSISMKAIEQYC